MCIRDRVIGDKINVSGILKFNAPGTLSNGELYLKGGTLIINENSSIISDIIHQDNALINVSENQTLNYNGKSLKLGASKLKLSGDGFIENSNDIELNDPLSILELDGLKVSRISFTEEQTDGKLVCLLYTSPSPRDRTRSRMPSSA